MAVKIMGAALIILAVTTSSAPTIVPSPEADGNPFIMEKYSISLAQPMEKYSISLAQPKDPGRARFSKPAFTSGRLFDLPTPRALEKHELLFTISHRFIPPLDSGFDSFHGLDGPATVRLSLGFGILENLSVTMGRTNLPDEIELLFSWLMFKQDEDDFPPVTMAIVPGASISTETTGGEKIFRSENYKFNLQLSISRQIVDGLTVLLVPSYCPNTDYLNPGYEETFVFGVGGRFNFYGQLSLVGELYYNLRAIITHS